LLKFPSEEKPGEFHVLAHLSFWRWESALIVSKAPESNAENLYRGTFLRAERKSIISLWTTKSPTPA
jgi:hypothetical protein